MKRKRPAIRAGAVILTATVFLTLAAIVIARVSSSYDLSWHVISGGGARMESTGHTVHGTLGQPATGHAASSGYTLCSGFWCDEGAQVFRVYVPVVLMSSP
jgi:hypothetical protein